MTYTKATELMQQLGFSAYESKAYLGLLLCQPATAYEVSKSSGVPTSKVYETLSKLTQRGIVQATEPSESGTQQYVALKPEDFSQQLKSDTITRADELLPLLDAISSGPSNDYVWPLSTQDQVLIKATEMLTQSKKNILISCWAEDLPSIKQSLLKAESRGIKVAFVHFGKSDEKIGATYYHPIEKTLYAEKGGRGMTLVVDGESVLIAHFGENGALDASWSKNRAFVTVAEDYIKHDVYITKVTRHLNSEMRERFGEHYEQLRDIFSPEA